MSPRASDRQSTTTRARVRSSVKLECSAGPVCFDNLGVSEGASTVALRPVGEVAARSEPSLLRLLDTEKSGQLSRARDRLSSFCKKLRRTISECSYKHKYPLLPFINIDPRSVLLGSSLQSLHQLRTILNSRQCIVASCIVCSPPMF